MFIDLNSNVDDSKPPSRSLFEYVKEVLTRPQWIMSDISIDKPYKHAISILLIIGVTLGLGLGFHGSLWFRSGIVGAFYGGVFFPFVFGISLLILAALFYWFGKTLDGSGTYSEIAVPVIFASIPIFAVNLIPLIDLFVSSVSNFIILPVLIFVIGATIRLVYFAVMAGHRFSGFQSVLTLTSPILFAGLVLMAVFFVTVVGSLISFG
ncbi:MAG: Yip1 family protein [Chloroflexota bacterium]|nr:Yip1 family protein [Chloroflexota bacterium]